MARHPKGLYLLFVTEMWERFSYYGMRAIFVLYMTNALLFDKAVAARIYGSYTGLIFLTPLLGGYVADRYWGNRRSIIVGGLLMAAGQFCLFLSGSMYYERNLAIGLMCVGLGLMIFGNGFFKPNISTMVGQLYPPADRRIDAGFTIFYMGINLGAFLAPLVCGGVGERYSSGGQPLPEYFRWGFLAAGIGMLISVIFFIAYKNLYLVTPEGKDIGAEPNRVRDAQAIDGTGGYSAGAILTWGALLLVLGLLFYHGFAFGFVAQPLLSFTSPLDYNALISAVIFATAITMLGFIISDKSLTAVERDRIWVIYVVVFFVIFFWSAFEQAGASLTYFAEEQTQRTINLDLPMVAVHWISLGLVAVLAAIFLWGRRVLREEPTSLRILLNGLLAAGLGYLIYQNLEYVRQERETLSFKEIPASYFQSVNAIGIVLFAPLFSSLWTRLGNRGLEPPSVVKQALGLLFLALGYLLIAFRVRDLDPTVKVSMFWLTALYVTHTWGELCLSPIGLSLVSKLAPARFASLLMGVWFLANATASNCAGWLSALYPPSEKEFQSAAKVGIDLPAILHRTITPTAEQLEALRQIGVRTSYPELFGMEIHDLYQFFLIFVFSAGFASFLLLLLSRKLLRMMHGIR
ncbi:MAG TPA: peptide MFS transporter [Gemmataceae bacterium]|nr:peptide MFS transporter [Gemmataceae bacterium]